MGSKSSKIFTALVALIIFATGYQLITNAGMFLAEEVFKIPIVDFWLFSFLGVLGLGLLLGLDPTKLLK